MKKHQSQHQSQLTPQLCAALFPHLPELELQREQLTREIDQVRAHGIGNGSMVALMPNQPQTPKENEPGNGKTIHPVPAKANKRKRKVSAEHKERLSIAAKARWAKRKAA